MPAGSDTDLRGTTGALHMARAFRACTLVVAVALVAACTVKNTDTPALTGPSELGLSLTLQAVPDVVIQDGESRAQVVVTARDPNAQPVRNLALRAEISHDSALGDYGTLAPSRNIVTGSDGKAIVTYTPPKAPLDLMDGGGNIVTILITPFGTDYSTAVSRSVQIRLVPPSTVIPPSGALFTYWPASPKVDEEIHCDASLSTVARGRTISLYEWDFGDGHLEKHRDSANASHEFAAVGEYVVRLTITDNKGAKASVARTVKVVQ